MIKEIRKEEKKLANYIRYLQDRKYIKVYLNETGYVCYDEDELKEHKSKVKIGRPSKYRS